MFKGYKGNEYEIPDAHPAANCLPWNLDGPDFADLIESVKAGYDGEKPVLVQADTELIISGRRRALACVIAGVDPVTREVDWDDEQVNSYVRRDELIRRNLTEAQRVAAIADLSELNSHGANQHKNKGKEEVPAGTSSATQKEIAAEAGAGIQTVKRVAAVKKSAPELLPLIREGKLEANTAARAAKELTPKQVKQIANADDPKAEAKKLLPAKPKAKPAAPKDSDPLRGGNNFDFGANAPEDDEPEPRPEILSTPRGEIVIDPFKRIVPNNIGDYFGNVVWPNALQDGEIAAAAIETFRHAVEKAQRTPWLYIDSLKIINRCIELRNDVVKLLDLIHMGQPYALCAHCEGKKCKDCRNTGYVTKGMTDLEPEVYAAHARKAGAA